MRTFLLLFTAPTNSRLNRKLHEMKNILLELASRFDEFTECAFSSLVCHGNKHVG